MQLPATRQDYTISSSCPFLNQDHLGAGQSRLAVCKPVLAPVYSVRDGKNVIGIGERIAVLGLPIDAPGAVPFEVVNVAGE